MVDGTSSKPLAPTRVDQPGVFHRTPLWDARRCETGLGFSTAPDLGQSSES